jgi:hypothetical protein
MKTLLQVIDQKSNNTWNLGLKFWWWALETITHRFYSEGFLSKQKKLYFTRPNDYNNKYLLPLIFRFLFVIFRQFEMILFPFCYFKFLFKLLLLIEDLKLN